jgi:uncharacterized SAM-binding protein YcdF (DUF218 family)
VRTAVVFWAIEAILLAGAIFLGALLYRKIRRRPARPADQALELHTLGFDRIGACRFFST